MNEHQREIESGEWGGRFWQCLRTRDFSHEWLTVTTEGHIPASIIIDSLVDCLQGNRARDPREIFHSTRQSSRESGGRKRDAL